MYPLGVHVKERNRHLLFGAHLHLAWPLGRRRCMAWAGGASGLGDWRGAAAALPLLYALLLLHAGAGKGGGCGLQASGRRAGDRRRAGGRRLLLWCCSGRASTIGGGCSCRLLLRASAERGAAGFSSAARQGLRLLWFCSERTGCCSGATLLPCYSAPPPLHGYKKMATRTETSELLI
jgi:hypothetical protein